jgi:hypothetical protein
MQIELDQDHGQLWALMLGSVTTTLPLHSEAGL